MENLNSQTKGRITELKVANAFLELGYIISQPLVDTRYDYLVEINNKIYKIQVKTASLYNGCIKFSTANTHTNTQGTVRKTYKNEIDFFATIYENKCYLIPVDECGSSNKSLRLELPKDGIAKKNMVWAKDYELKEVINRLPD